MKKDGHEVIAVLSDPAEKTTCFNSRHAYVKFAQNFALRFVARLASPHSHGRPNNKKIS